MFTAGFVYSNSVTKSAFVFMALLSFLINSGPTIGVRAASSQQSSTGSNNQATREHVAKLLSSEVITDRAWGAYLAAENSYPDFVPRLIKLFEAQGDYSIVHAISQQIILDSLIRLRANISEEFLTQLFYGYQVEAIIFSSTDPKKHEALLLKQLRYAMDNNVAMDYLQWQAIANMLCDLKTPGFGSYLLNGLRIESHVWITDQGGIPGGTGPSGPPTPPGNLSSGFPPIAFYCLTVDNSDSTLKDNSGKHPVTYSRVISETGQRPRCSIPARDLTAPRIIYLADMLGNRVQGNDLVSQRFQYVFFTDASKYENEITKIRKRFSDSWNGFLDALLNQNLITKEERQKVDKDPLIRVYDERIDKTKTIPEIPSLKNVVLSKRY